MHILNILTLFIVLTLIGAEFSVSTFVNPSAWRLDPKPQLQILSHFASLLEKVMPFWYSACLLLLGFETWLYRQTPDFTVLLTATVIWIVASAASFIFLVPLNNRVAEGVSGWQQIHRTWDLRHRVRVAAFAIAGLLLASVVVR